MAGADVLRPLLSDGEEPELCRRQDEESADHLQSSSRRQADDETASTNFVQSVANMLNLLVGIGMLSVPFAVAQAGLCSLLLLGAYGVLAAYSALLLRRSMDASPSSSTYADIAGAAFGDKGRTLIWLILYTELYMSVAEDLILLGDTLAALAPTSPVSALSAPTFWTMLATAVVVPTTWTRRLTCLAYISACGVLASILATVLLIGEGFSYTGFGRLGDAPLMQLKGVPLAIGVFGYGFAGHAIFPSFYSGMRNREEYAPMIGVSFGLASAQYVGIALLGIACYGPGVGQNVVSHMQAVDPTSTFSAMANVVMLSLPFAKVALVLNAVATAVEELPGFPKPADCPVRFRTASITLRTCMMIVACLIGVTIPFFGFVAGLIGAMFSVSISLTIPAAIYLRLRIPAVKREAGLDGALCVGMMVVGVIATVVGTTTAVVDIVRALQGN